MLIPYVIERTSQGERASDIFSRLLKDRIVFINGPISTEMSHAIVAQLLFLEAESTTEDILLYLNSPGGEVTAGMAIYDTIKFIKCDVSTIAMGQVCSMGSLLASSGTKGKRLILPNCRHMIHQPSGGAGGQATDMEIQVKEILKMKKSLTEIYVKNTGQTYKKLVNDMERDNFMSAEESVAYGLADKVITSR